MPTPCLAFCPSLQRLDLCGGDCLSCTSKFNARSALGRDRCSLIADSTSLICAHLPWYPCHLHPQAHSARGLRGRQVSPNADNPPPGSSRSSQAACGLGDFKGSRRGISGGAPPGGGHSTLV